jgi:hypothetical protein
MQQSSAQTPKWLTLPKGHTVYRIFFFAAIGIATMGWLWLLGYLSVIALKHFSE